MSVDRERRLARYARYNNSEKGRERYRRSRRKRTEAGLCDSCGKRPISLRAETKCEECLVGMSIRNADKQIAKYTDRLERLRNNDPELLAELGLTVPPRGSSGP